MNNWRGSGWEQGLGDQGLGEQGLGEQCLGEHGLGEQGLGKQGFRGVGFRGARFRGACTLKKSSPYPCTPALPPGFLWLRQAFVRHAEPRWRHRLRGLL